MEIARHRGLDCNAVAGASDTNVDGVGEGALPELRQSIERGTWPCCSRGGHERLPLRRRLKKAFLRWHEGSSKLRDCAKGDVVGSHRRVPCTSKEDGIAG